jgi:hypothetical protein
MGRNRIIKICCIVGFVLAEVYMVFVVLAPPRAPGSPEPSTRMFIPKEMIPPIEGAVPGAPPPATRIMQLVIAAFFFGPFGACVGLGAGLLIEGARQKLFTLQSAFRQRK